MQNDYTHWKFNPPNANWKMYNRDIDKQETEVYVNS